MSSDPAHALRRFADRYEAAARLGDMAGVSRAVDDARATGAAIPDIHAFVIAPAMVAIGDLWERGALGVADEHLATAITIKEVERLYELSPTADLFREEIVLAAVEGEEHVLGLRMSADLLEAAGFRTHYLGGGVPASALVEFVVRSRPAAVVLSVKQPSLGMVLTSEVRALGESSGAFVLVGGDGVPGSLRQGGPPVYVPGVDAIVDAVERALA
jgi:methanogenic corrinoid protein MtbC1